MKQEKDKDRSKTLLEAILAMQRKIEEQTPLFEKAELTFNAEMGDGRIITRANPLVQEYRALVKDYSQAVKAYAEMTGNQNSVTAGSLDELRTKYKVIA